MDAERLALLAAGWFFLVGLASGGWKYVAIARSDEAKAPVYVDIAHRASLLYAFACVLIERLSAVSQLDPRLEWFAVLAQVVFFGLAVGTYLIHGILDDTENQLQHPHRLGRATLPPIVIRGFMTALVCAEVGGFLVLFWGALNANPAA